MITLPHSDEAERALIGAILINPEAVRTLNLDADDIYIERNRVIYTAITALTARHVEPDYLTVSDELKRGGRLAEIGGGAYLTELLSDTPSSLHAEDYAAIVRQNARRRRVIQEAQTLVRAAFDEGANLDEAIANAAAKLVTNAGGEKRARPIGEVLSDLYDQIEAASANPQDVFGIPTGLKGFDRITAGLHPGEVFLLSGEPGVGKSFLAMQLVTGAAEGVDRRAGVPGAVFQLEMSAIATVRRSLSARARIPARSMRAGKLTDAEWTTLTRAIETMSELPIWISDDTDWTTTGLRAELARLKTHGVQWALIDYLPLLQDEGKDENETLARISNRVHAIAKDLDLAVVAISDMSKAGITGQTKGQASLAGTRKLIYDADMVAFLKTTDAADIFNLEWGKFREDSPDRMMQLRRVPGFPAYAEVRRP